MAPTSKTDEHFGGLQALEPKRNNLLWEVLWKSEDTPPLRLYWLLSDSSPLGTHSIGAGVQSTVQRIFRTELRSYICYRKTHVLFNKCLWVFNSSFCSSFWRTCTQGASFNSFFKLFFLSLSFHPVFSKEGEQGYSSGVWLGFPWFRSVVLQITTWGSTEIFLKDTPHPHLPLTHTDALTDTHPCTFIIGHWWL